MEIAPAKQIHETVVSVPQRKQMVPALIDIVVSARPIVVEPKRRRHFRRRLAADSEGDREL